MNAVAREIEDAAPDEPLLQALAEVEVERQAVAAIAEQLALADADLSPNGKYVQGLARAQRLADEARRERNAYEQRVAQALREGDEVPAYAGPDPAEAARVFAAARSAVDDRKAAMQVLTNQLAQRREVLRWALVKAVGERYHALGREVAYLHAVLEVVTPRPLGQPASAAGGRLAIPAYPNSNERDDTGLHVSPHTSARHMDAVKRRLASLAPELQGKGGW